MKFFYDLFIVLIILLILVTSGIWYSESRYFVSNTRASEVVLSPESSYLFVTPPSIPLASGGKVKGVLFCIDTRGIGIEGLPVSVDRNPSLNVEYEDSSTDSKGKAVFYIRSLVSGSYILNAYCGSNKIQSTLRFSFY
ncbi:MAG: hypothetical protein ACMG6E_00565 [Candidatus Roizmanbacteria bacterium]